MNEGMKIMAKEMEMAEDKCSYETAIARLEEIVQRLETGELPLEESLALFEEGIKLTAYCTGKLDAAEGKLQILLGFEGDEPKLAPFETNNLRV